MKNRTVLKTLSILSFSAAFLLASVSVPFLGSAGADTQIDFIKQVKQEGDASYTQNLTVTDNSKPVIFRIYVYNPTDTTYTNGLLRDEFPFDQTGTVKNRTLLSSDQTPLYFSDAFINLPADKKLIYRAGSSRVYGYNDSVGTEIPDVNGLSPLITPQGLKINQIRGGEVQFKHWYVFYADIVDSSVPTPKPAPSMETAKKVNNITQNSGFTDSVSANKGDILEYRIWVHNKVVGSEAEDVVVKDALPIAENTKFVNKAFVSGSNFDTLTDTATVTTSFLARLEYIPGTTRTFVHADKSDGVLVADVSGQSKLFTSGVSLDTIKGCFEFERFVTFKVKVIKPQVLEVPPKEQPPVTTLPDTGPGAAAILILGSVPAGLAIRALRRKI
ncbi:MAG: hypothetical protein A2Z11_04370 [Candidatus Woykebacteria bacterium RBG_16_43_9]|uniref:DUF11 domain-containing protein n=1 Tax=Candidatus Woykebacteria bacterium RBG_16_43_9 TaxID=1802596 RepID=A0A1G1WEJ4_9BACT|nr:MAG: hypothetical protein A2Z11_04370 [Candidatus Woykebacteria bacterium RBG_16_43_9]